MGDEAADHEIARAELAKTSTAAISAADDLVRTAALLDDADVVAEVGRATSVLKRVQASIEASTSSAGAGRVEVSGSGATMASTSSFGGRVEVSGSGATMVSTSSFGGRVEVSGGAATMASTSSLYVGGRPLIEDVRSGLRAASAAIANLTGSGTLSASAPPVVVGMAGFSGEGTLTVVGAVTDGERDESVGLDEIYDLLSIMANALVEVPNKSTSGELRQWIALVIAFLTLVATMYPLWRPT